VPWEISTPKTSLLVSVWASKWTDVGLGDRMVAAEHDRDGAGVDNLSHGALDRGVRGDSVGRYDRSVAVVDDVEEIERSEACVEMRAQPADRGADCTRAQPGAREIAGEVVHGRPDDRHVHAREVLDALRVGDARKREQARVIGLPGLQPARVGVDRRQGGPA
jgi:hypothetical protein